MNIILNINNGKFIANEYKNKQIGNELRVECEYSLNEIINDSFQPEPVLLVDSNGINYVKILKKYRIMPTRN